MRKAFICKRIQNLTMQNHLMVVSPLRDSPPPGLNPDLEGRN